MWALKDDVRYWVFGIVDLIRNPSVLEAAEEEGESVRKSKVQESDLVKVLWVCLRWWQSEGVMGRD